MFPNTYNTKTKQVKTIRLQVTFFIYDIEYQIKIYYHILYMFFFKVRFLTLEMRNCNESVHKKNVL